MKNNDLKHFIKNIPKAELHLHIEGTLEPELMFKIAKRNNITPKYKTVEDLKNAYKFSNLQEFLDIYYEGAGVLVHQQDFFDMTWEHLQKVHKQNVIHVEVFFDPQTHTSRGVTFHNVITGINDALKEGEEKLGISFKLMMCFLRHLDEASAFETLRESLPYKKLITAVGLDSSEKGNPPSKFKRVFKEAIKEGFLTVAHAGEEGPSDYVWDAIHSLQVSRVDHGNRSLDDEKLVDFLVSKQIPLTLCPLSNLKLRVVKDLKNHPLLKMFNLNLLVTVNSDDPAYFDGYINENLYEVCIALQLNKEHITQLAINSILSSFLSETDKNYLIQKIKDCASNYTKNPA